MRPIELSLASFATLNKPLLTTVGGLESNNNVIKHALPYLFVNNILGSKFYQIIDCMIIIIIIIYIFCCDYEISIMLYCHNIGVL